MAVSDAQLILTPLLRQGFGGLSNLTLAEAAVSALADSPLPTRTQAPIPRQHERSKLA